MLVFLKKYFEREKYLKYYCKSSSNLQIIGKLNFSFLNLVAIQNSLSIKVRSQKNLVYYFPLSHMHLRDSEILTRDSLTITLMPYFYIFDGIIL